MTVNHNLIELINFVITVSQTVLIGNVVEKLLCVQLVQEAVPSFYQEFL